MRYVPHTSMSTALALNCSEDSPKVQGVVGEPVTSPSQLLNASMSFATSWHHPDTHPDCPFVLLARLFWPPYPRILLKPGRDSLQTILKRCGIDLTPGQVNLLWSYHQRLRAANARLNLTRIHNFENMVL